MRAGAVADSRCSYMSRGYPHTSRNIVTYEAQIEQPGSSL